MKAIIYDMDGVIIDSEIHWDSDEMSLIKALIPNWTDDDQHQLIGLNVSDIHQKLVNEYGVKIDKATWMKKVDKVATNIYQNKAKLLPDFLNLAQKVKDVGYPTGIASSSTRKWIDITVRKHSLGDLLTTTVSAFEVDGPGKPAPDVYLACAAKLGVKPQDCLVIEDSYNGIKAAKTAGMQVIGFRNTFNDFQDLSEADIELAGHQAVSEYLFN